MTSSVGARRRRRRLAEVRHVTGVAGNTVVLRCDLPRSDPPSVRWIDYVYNTSPEPEVIVAAGGTEVQRTHPNADNFRVDADFSLTVSSLRVKESPGQYVCESQVDGITHQLDYQLTVCSMLSKIVFFIAPYLIRLPTVQSLCGVCIISGGAKGVQGRHSPPI